MKFECEGKVAIESPKETQIRRAVASLRTYGKSSFASLTDDLGNYVQVLGGGVTCLLEYYRAESNERFRGVTGSPNRAFPDGTLLVCGNNQIPMKSDEWFRSDQVADVFSRFLAGEAFPFGVSWRAAPGF